MASDSGDITEIPVLICGGGPVGLALAVDLGMRGVRCMVVERRDGSVKVPKMNMVNARSMEFCRRWGIADEVIDIGWPDDFGNNIVFMTDLMGHELARFDYPSYGERGELSYTPIGSRRISQMLFDPLLAERAKQLPSVSLRYLTELEEYSQTDDHVDAVLRNRETNETETVRAAYLIGCDGAESMIREAADIGHTGSMRISSSVSFFVESKELRGLHDKGDAWVYWCFGPEGYWGGIGSTNADDLWRFSNYSFEDTSKVTEEDAKQSIRRSVGRDFEFDLKAILPWDRRSMVAERYVSGRVILAGDSAHSMSPTGGLGMNTGLGDAQALGWRLAAIFEGWGEASLLDTYDLERRPIAEFNVNESTTSFRKLDAVPRGPEILDDGTAGAGFRSDFGSAIKNGGFETEFEQEGTVLGYDYYDSPGIVQDGSERINDDSRFYEPQARPGHRAPHAWLREGYSTIDLFNEGPFTLLRTGGADASAMVKEAAARRIPLQVHNTDNPALAEAYGTALTLVRPDGHIGWHGNAEPEDVGDVLDRMRGSISPDTELSFELTGGKSHA